ncbi:DUF1697 domain-containing protein [Microbacterium sediminicola]|uniref:DUF1697 domain-containing protein n=1 Tax=Microbacterium sediminicola TaxID=415210 RepID=A0ABP4TYE2_9MICO
MTDWVALLRGVNVGGITIRSAELAELFRSLGFSSVRTVLASGNVAFGADGERGALKARIEAALSERFSYDAWVILVTRAEVSAAIADFPFDAEVEERQPWVIFCADAECHRDLMAAASTLDPVVDPVAAGAQVVYWNPVKGTTVSSPFAKVLARSRFTAVTTNRNLRTLRKIVG